MPGELGRDARGLGASLVVLCLVLAYRNGHPRGETVPLRQAVKIAIDALWGLVTLAIILGGILGGVFTAIEAGAVACLWAFFVTMFVYRDYRWRDLPELIHRTMRTVAMVMTLIAFASSVGYIMALMQVPARVTALLLTLSSDKNVILLLINVLLLVLGCLLDMAPSILIVTPILLPVVMKFGVDPLCRVRRRQSDHRAGGARDLAVLRRDVFRIDADHLHPGDFAVAAASAGDAVSRVRPR